MGDSSNIVNRTFELAVSIVKFSNKLDNESPKYRVLVRQLLKSGTSIGANVQEGQAAESKADFIHKYNIALKEARETKYWLRLLKSAEIISGEKVEFLINESDEISRILGKIIVNAKNNS